MKKVIITILSMGIINSYAQTTKPVHISVVQGVSTEGKESKNTDYGFSFNLFSGTANSIKGVEIGSFFNQNEGSMTGLQASGLVNFTKGNVTGFQASGLTNVSGSVLGFQNAGLSNHAKDVQGIQISGIANTAADVKGLQITGIYNQAKTLKGLQIGLVNKADSVEKGGGIGLINIYKKGGYREFEFSAADFQNAGISFKSGTKTIYSIFNVGYNFNPTSLMSTGFGIGSLRTIGNNLYFKPEIIWYNYITDDFKFNSSTNASHLKLGFMKKVGNIGLSLYPSVYYANIAKDIESKLTEISKIKPMSQTKAGRWGYGIGFGIGFLK